MRRFNSRHSLMLLAATLLCLAACSGVTGAGSDAGLTDGAIGHDLGTFSDASIDAPRSDASIIDAGMDMTIDSGSVDGDASVVLPWDASTDGDAGITCHLNLLSPMSTCAAGQSCYIVDGFGTQRCVANGTRRENAPCDGHSVTCAPGFVCAGIASPTCKRLCDLAAFSNPCGASEACVSYSDYAPAGVGICSPSM